jgi:hypothetical protein
VPYLGFGECLCALLQPKLDSALTAAAVRAWLSRELAAFKIPKTIEFRDSLGREDTGNYSNAGCASPTGRGAIGVSPETFPRQAGVLVLDPGVHRLRT